MASETIKALPATTFRFSLALLIAGFLPLTSHAVCLQAGCDRYNFEVPVAIVNSTNSPALVTTNGNVGFGTETPLQALHVLGSARLESESPDSSFIDFVISNATSGFTTTRFGTSQGGDFIFQSVDDSYLNPVTKMVISRSGKIGMGTDTPARTLHVQTTDGIRLSPSALPSSPSAGDITVDSGDSNSLKYYDGTNWVKAGSSGGGGSGSVTSISTGTGLTGGPITTTGTISIAAGGVGTTEIGDNQVTDAKITSVGASKVTSGTGLYLTYKPDNTACTTGQVLKWQNSRWECADDTQGEGGSSPLTTKGDIWVHDGSADNRLPVGSDGQVLTADSTQSTGISWKNAIASDLSSLATTGIVQRNGSSSFSTVTIASPLSYTGGTLGINTGSGGVLIDGGNNTISEMAIGTNSNQKLHLKTNGTPTLTLDPIGNIGVGTTTPSARLDIVTAGASSNETGLSVNNPSTDAYSVVNLNFHTGGAWKSAFWTMRDNTGDGATFGISTADSWGAGQERLRIAETGYVGIGTTNPTHILHINGEGRSTSSSWATTSDIRLKDVAGRFPYGLKEVLNLETIWFQYKRDNPLHLPSDKLHAGVSAQQVQSVIPEAVEKDKDGYLTLNMDPIHWAALNAIKELSAEIDELKSQNKLLHQHICAKEKTAQFCQ